MIYKRAVRVCVALLVRVAACGRIGFDPKQYGTPCAAARAHQSVLSLGACPI